MNSSLLCPRLLTDLSILGSHLNRARLHFFSSSSPSPPSSPSSAVSPHYARRLFLAPFFLLPIFRSGRKLSTQLTRNTRTQVTILPFGWHVLNSSQRYASSSVSKNKPSQRSRSSSLHNLFEYRCAICSDSSEFGSTFPALSAAPS